MGSLPSPAPTSAPALVPWPQDDDEDRATLLYYKGRLGPVTKQQMRRRTGRSSVGNAPQQHPKEEIAARVDEVSQPLPPVISHSASCPCSSPALGPFSAQGQMGTNTRWWSHAGKPILAGLCVGLIHLVLGVVPRCMGYLPDR